MIKATFSYYLFFSAQTGETVSTKAAELQVCAVAQEQGWRDSSL